MMIPKVNPNHKRRKPKRGDRGKFSPSVRHQILDRDDGLCRVCKRPAQHIHHVQPKGSGKGRGVFTNGLSVCNNCHDAIHRSGEKLQFWKDVFTEMYGPDYYKDEWDYE